MDKTFEHHHDRAALIHNAMTAGVIAGLIHGPKKRARTKKQILRAVDRIMNHLGYPVELLDELDTVLVETATLERMLEATDEKEAQA